MPLPVRSARTVIPIVTADKMCRLFLKLRLQRNRIRPRIAQMSHDAQALPESACGRHISRPKAL